MPAFDQLVTHVAKFRKRSQGRFTVPMVIRTPYSGGIRALEHHSESEETLYMHTPGLKVVIPSTPYDTRGLLISAIRDPNPVVFMEPKKIYRAFKQEVPEKEYSIPIGKAKTIKEGDDLTVIAWGSILHPTLDAVKQFEEKGKSIEVIDLRTMAPMDTDAIINSVKKTGRLLVVQEAIKTLGPASEIITLVNEHAMLSLEAPPVRVTGFDVAFPLFKLEDYFLPNIKRISKGIEDALS